jgi:hypothetical protein
MNTTPEPTAIDGINTDTLRAAVEAIAQDPGKGITRWQAATHWTGGLRSETCITTATVGGQRLARNFRICVDEPLALCASRP